MLVKNQGSRARLGQSRQVSWGWSSWSLLCQSRNSAGRVIVTWTRPLRVWVFCHFARVLPSFRDVPGPLRFREIPLQGLVEVFKRPLVDLCVSPASLHEFSLAALDPLGSA